MAIESKNGRSRSFRLQEEVERELVQEFKNLTAEEQQAYLAIANEMGMNNQLTQEFQPPLLLDALYEVEYKRPLVDMKTFVYDEYYLGITCASLYPSLLKDFVEMFDGGYREVILSGSLGWGKSFLASIAICRLLYEISCMVDPHKAYNLSPGSNIAFVCFAVNEQVAQRVAFDNISTKIQASAYFRENYNYKSTMKELRFPGNVWVAARATTDGGAIGLNLIGAFLDEADFMPKNPKSSTPQDARTIIPDFAERVYNGIIRRMQSRFQNRGRLPGMLFLISSKNTAQDFTQRRIREASDLAESTVFVRDYATWDVKQEGTFSSQKFYVLCGNEQVDSRLVQDEEVDYFQRNLPDGCTLLEVPIDYRPAFVRDLDGAIRDIAGIATVAVSPFVRQRDRIDSAVDTHRMHPFQVKDAAPLVNRPPQPGEVEDESHWWFDQTRKGVFNWEKLVRVVTEEGERKLRPIFFPRAARHAHIDLSVNRAATGIAMGCVGGLVDIQRQQPSGQIMVERLPLIHIDFLLRIVPPIAGEIDIRAVRDLIYLLSKNGFIITQISMDRFQSAESFQAFRDKGFKVEHVSAQRTTEQDPMAAYTVMRTALYEGRLRYYYYPPLMTELRTLQVNWDKRQVEKAKRGRKDVSDALACISYTLSSQKLDYSSVAQPIVMSGNFALDPQVQLRRQASVAQAEQRLPPIAPGRPRSLEDTYDIFGGQGGILPVLGGGRGR